MDCSSSVEPQAPLPMGFCKQEYWSGLSFPSPGDLPDPGTEPRLLCLLHWQVGYLLLAPPGNLSLFHLEIKLAEFSLTYTPLICLCVCICVCVYPPSQLPIKKKFFP